MKVLSLFDGISCGHLALDIVGVDVETYYRSEIDKYANQISKFQYPNAINLGDVTKWRDWDIPWDEIDLVIGGFPCQAFSFAGKQLAFEDARGKLAYVTVEILNHLRKESPNIQFLFENVKMKKEYKDALDAIFEVPHIVINSNLVSAQNRHRLYWTNIPDIEQPEDRGLLLRDIVESEIPFDELTFTQSKKTKDYKRSNVATGKAACLTATYAGDIQGYGRPSISTKNYVNSDIGKVENVKFLGVAKRGRYDKNGKVEQKVECSGKEKANSLTTVQKDSLVGHYLTQDQVDKAKSNYASKTWKSGNKMGAMKFPDGDDRKSKTISTGNSKGARETHHIERPMGIRRLTPLECERLQTLPDNYTFQGINSDGKKVVMSNTQRYKTIGNGWTVDVISHIFENLKLK